MLSATAHREVDATNSCLYIVDGSDISYKKFADAELSKYFGKITYVHAGSMTIPRFAQELPKHTHVLTSSFGFMNKLAQGRLEGSDSDNEGLMLTVGDVSIVMTQPLKQLVTTRSGKFMFRRWIKKCMRSGKDFLQKDPFTWRFLTPDNLETALKLMRKSWLCAVDIETTREGKLITSVAYTCIIGQKTYSHVINFGFGQDIKFAHKAMQLMNNTAVPKVMQNGMYDSVYFLRFNAPLRNYIYDTYHMMHCMYQELPKTLSFTSSFFLNDYLYWKDQAGVNLYEYNAKDTHNTLWCWIAQCIHARYDAPWAWANYVQEFPVVFPAISCELEGVKIIPEEIKKLHDENMEKADEAFSAMQNLLGLPEFNPNSPKQMLAAVNALAKRQRVTYNSTGKTEMQRFAESDPLNERLIEHLKIARKHKKAATTYFKEDKFFNGRLHAKIDPAGTETGRTSSSASSLWCGHNIQNIPPYAKSAYCADEGFLLFEVDKSQAESWCTGYLSQDRALLEVLHTSPDFHCSNAELFFGIPFAELYDVSTGKKLNKSIRDLAKRTNHGANYNMGAQVLWDTMGTANLLEAARLLGLPSTWLPIAIAGYLLDCFDRAYPTIRDKNTGYYARIIREVNTTGKLVGPTGYTRRTFLQPSKNKLDLNTICAHGSQSLSGLLVNKAWVRALELQLDKYPGLLRMKAMIHDSIFGQVRIGHEHIVTEIEKIMHVPVTVHGRVLDIPGDEGPLGHTWLDIKD